MLLGAATDRIQSAIHMYVLYSNPYHKMIVTTIPAPQLRDALTAHITAATLQLPKSAASSQAASE
jgi:hypothetical protein